MELYFAVINHLMFAVHMGKDKFQQSLRLIWIWKTSVFLLTLYTNRLCYLLVITMKENKHYRNWFSKERISNNDGIAIANQASTEHLQGE